MKRFLIILLAGSLILHGCTGSKHATSSGPTEVPSGNRDGSSQANAVIIQEKTETTGVDAEYAWLRKNYPGYTFKSQSLIYGKDGHPYDMLSIKTAAGVNKDVWFDISNYFGKF